ncbi:isobutyryl-CoA dehydrogenase, mitochondrial precursor [Reticulomyxa filosa]|uniref:Isobutyryl-CoA dehydrogenase, mitochondrial n=1 Tax=Reticulomyxa filosa TaxID=46433 RepID=X6NIF2_RETFI|nr:isobutyryl-CoA dehydrogenase, mitochondrial precursor [Reticulomyxa filosa]|eukprot:ETO25766.1 isobutyryl-CoA dehydrogenase, mitochondrial precursor [Reticulomyxa filosa]
MQKIGLNEDQLAYQQLALDFMESKLKPNAKHWDEKHEIDISAIQEAAKLGFGGLYIPTAYGGTGLSRHDTTIVFEALSQGCVSTTSLITIHNMTAWMLSKFGNEELRKKYLPQMLTCETMGSYCLTEPHSGSDSASLKISCKRDGNDYVINGQKVFISGGGFNSLYFVMVRTGEHKTRGISCVVVPKDTKGLRFGAREKKMGWNASPTTQVFLMMSASQSPTELAKKAKDLKLL